MNKIQGQKIEQFLEQLASKNPTPGGGAVAALVGATAASLVVMVCKLTKEGSSITRIENNANSLKSQLLNLSDEDCEAFDEVVVAYKSKNKRKIKKALQKAIKVPSETKRFSKKVERLARVVIKRGNKNAESDAKTAVYLAVAAQKSAEENIKINKRAIDKL